MSRNIFGNKKFVKTNKHSRMKHSESDIRWEQFKIFIWIVLLILWIYYIIQPQLHFE